MSTKLQFPKAIEAALRGLEPVDLAPRASLGSSGALVFSVGITPSPAAARSRKPSAQVRIRTPISGSSTPGS